MSAVPAPTDPRPPRRGPRLHHAAPPAGHYRSRSVAPFEFVRLPREDSFEPLKLPDGWRPHLMVDSIHDGDVIPPVFLRAADGKRIPERRFVRDYERERDWGAAMVAEAMARALGLDGHYRVNIARVVMDFGRFPGLTGRDASHLQRFAINYPFSDWLTFEQKKLLLDGYYDVVSAGIDAAVRKATIKIAIHTYDTHNPAGTLRPEISVCTRSAGLQHEGAMPVGVFDPLYPDELGAFTCNRVLRDRLSITLEKAGLPVAHNYPYLLPEGSVEVRAQVWSFFDFLRRRFEDRWPQTATEPAFQRVWAMLLDTNLRSAESEALRSYLHMYRTAPPQEAAAYREAGHAYERVRAYLAEQRDDVLEGYRFAAGRLSSLAIEVRKDLVWTFNDEGRPVAPRAEAAARIGTLIARAVQSFLIEDVGPYGEGGWMQTTSQTALGAKLAG